MSKEVTISLKGNFRGKEKSRQLREMVENKRAGGVSLLYIDLSQTADLDFETLTELLSLRNSFAESGSRLLLKNSPEKIRQLLKIFRVKVFQEG